jgi:hypothetical protein
VSDKVCGHKLKTTSEFPCICKLATGHGTAHACTCGYEWTAPTIAISDLRKEIARLNEYASKRIAINEKLRAENERLTKERDELKFRIEGLEK